MTLWVRRAWLQITADRRRFGMLCAMCCIGLLLWARIIIIAKLPRTAVADGQANAQQTTSQRGMGGSDNRDRKPLMISLWDQPRRDPFLIQEDYYPRSTPFTTLNGEAGKSGPKQAETPERVEARLVEHLRAQVREMKLQAVMTGSPMAVIDGRMYRPGSRIPAPKDEQIRFLLVEVRERSVILEFEGRRFTLEVPFPGEA
jgi:hypothetical protein